MKLKSLGSREEMTGKTIKNVVLRVYEGEMLIHFTDDTFILFESSADCDGELEIEVIDCSNDYWKYYLNLFLQAEIITQEEVDQINLEKVVQNRKQVEEHELAQLERLKKKYEKGN